MAESNGSAVDPLAIRRSWTPDRTGLVHVDRDEALSYRSLDDAAWAVADWIGANTDADAPTVGVVVDRHPAVGPLVFGGFRAGARIVLLNTELPAAELQTRFDRVAGDLLVCSAETRAIATSMDAPRILRLDPGMEPAISTFDPFEEDASTDPDQRDNSGALEGELVAFTSGTAGDPKGVKLDLPSLVASALGSALRLGVAADDRWLVPIPTYHVGGLSPLVRCSQAGTTAIVQGAFDADRTIETVSEFDVTCASLVPTQLTRMLDAGWHSPDTLRFVLVGGGPVSPDLLERCANRGVPACPTYGTTETASQVATARPEEARAHVGTVGRPLALTDVSIRADGEPCDPGSVGEIVVDGPTVSPGYLDAERTAAAFDEVGFWTGDLGYRDDDGRLWIEGRRDDRIVTGGEVVSATTVADAIGAMDGVADVAVVGIDDREWGERVCALVEIPSEGDGPTVELIRSHCRSELPTYAVPKTIAFTDRLPRTPSGTIDRAAVEKRIR